MKILALETTGKNGSAAVYNDGQISLALSDGEMSHLKDVITISEDAINAAGINKSELNYIAASVGPGSFTGIRIGVTTARTMAQMLMLPCVGVSSLEAMAQNVKEDAKSKACDAIVSIINARRHQTYAGAWALDADGKLSEICEQRQYMIEELLDIVGKKCGGKLYFVGDGIDAYEDIIAETLPIGAYEFAPEEIRYQTAQTIAELAAEKVKMGADVSYEDLLPNYMRLSEAEQRLKEGTLSSKIKKQD